MSCNYEIWRDIPGYEGYYQVSNFGRVKSLSRKVYNRGGFHISKEKILKQQLRKDRYFNVHLLKEGIVKIFFVHRLVALAFLPNPNQLPDINHKDENPSNNCVDNLEWCTEKYNMNYGTVIERRKASFVRNNSFKKANATKVKNGSRGAEKPVEGISKDGGSTLSYRSICEASRETGISQGNIGECCRGIRSSAGGYYWKYKTI
jgi:hypothetical protein